MTGRLSVLLADDHDMIRETLAAWLRNTTDIVVVASVADADKALSEAVRLKPDVVVLDIDMPGHSFDTARAVRNECASTRVVFLSAFHNDQYIDQALEARASGYVVKHESVATIVEAIRIVASGGVFFSRDVQSRIVVDVDGPRLTSRRQSRVSAPTRREVEILQYVAQGLANKEIARAASISIRTVERHVADVMERLDIRRRVELARFAIREGLATT